MITVPEKAFPEIVDRYNSGGRSAANDYIREAYKIKHPYFVIDRIKKSGKYQYEASSDRFIALEKTEHSPEGLFMSLDDLCEKPLAEDKGNSFNSPGTETMDKLIRSLLSDRLMQLSKYITIDSASRTVMIDRTTLLADGYWISMH